jgi:predicted nucleic acid-binding protein
MSGDFIDSNVIIYLFDETDARKRDTAKRLMQQALETGKAAISYQVVQETLNVITGKLSRSATPEQARRFLDKVLMPLWRVMPSAALYRRALDIQTRWRFGFYDSLIVAAALDANCNRLLSEDLHPGQRVEGLVIENPFNAAGADRGHERIHPKRRGR